MCGCGGGGSEWSCDVEYRVVEIVYDGGDSDWSCDVEYRVVEIVYDGGDSV